MPKPQNQYLSLDNAFDYFNDKLFGNTLPPLLITFRMKRKAYGYYWHEMIESRQGEKPVSELALNIATFDGRTDKEILSTLVHEMCHHWQYCFGEPTRNGYHNKEFAAKMKSIGLHCSNTGQEGGKETGQAMSHYIMQDGPFNAFCDALLKDGAILAWQSYEKPATPKIKPAKPEGGEDDDEEGTEATTKTANKVKYTCSQCSMNVWGKPDLMIACVRDKIQLTQIRK